MDIIEELAQAFLMLIRAGSGLRIIYCFIAMAGDEEQSTTYKKRIKNTVGFYIMAECIWIIRDLVMSYYVR
jgi:hypothetical protein